LAAVGQESRSVENQLFWLQRLVSRVRFWGKPIKFYWLAILIPALIILGHFLISLVTNGLGRFENDEGLWLTATAWVATLLAIDVYTRRASKLIESLKVFTTHDDTEKIRIRNLIFGKWMLITGAIFAASELGLLFVSYNPLTYVTGLQEIPYSGGPVLAMKYTSIPAYIWTNFFWCFFFFLIGNGVWIYFATLFVAVHRLVHPKTVPKVDLFDSEIREKVPLVGSTIIAAVGILSFPLIILSPLVETDITNPALLPRLFGIWEVVFVAYAAVLIVGLSSMYPLHKLWEEQKRFHLNRLTANLSVLYKKYSEANPTNITENDYRDLFFLRNQEAFLEKIHTWPFDRRPTRIALTFVYYIVFPFLLAELAQFVASVLH